MKRISKIIMFMLCFVCLGGIFGCATNAEKFEIVASSNNSNWGVVVGGGSYEKGEVVTLGAVAKNGYEFKTWNDGVTQNPRTITVNSNKTYTATFEAKQPVAPTVSTSEITVSENYSSCGKVYGGGTYENNTQCILFADVTDKNAEFLRWNDGNKDNPRVVNVTEDKEYQALFQMKECYVDVTSQEGGKVTGKGYYAVGEQVTLVAVADPGYIFLGWKDQNYPNITNIKNVLQFSATEGRKVVEPVFQKYTNILCLGVNYVISVDCYINVDLTNGKISFTKMFQDDKELWSSEMQYMNAKQEIKQDELYNLTNFANKNYIVRAM